MTVPRERIESRFDAFDVQGIVPVAYALFAVALGIAVGSVISRVLPSLAVTLAVFVALRVAIGTYLHPHDMAPVTKVFPLLGHDSGPSGAWTVSQGLVSPNGRSLGPGIDFSQIPAACQAAPPPGSEVLLGQCLAAHCYHQTLTYQPANRFWAFQGVEAAIFVILAAALMGFAIWWVLGRDASS